MELLENAPLGLMLRGDYLEPPGLSAYKAAKGTGLTPIHISELLHGERKVTPMTSLQTGKCLGMSPGSG